MKTLVIAVLCFPLVHGAYVAMLGTSVRSSPLLQYWFPAAYLVIFAILFGLNWKRSNALNSTHSFDEARKGPNDGPV